MNEELPIRGELLTDERALRREATRKRKDYVETSVLPQEVEGLEKKGFSVIRKLKTKVKMAKPVSSAERLERRMWILFFLLGYPAISKNRYLDVLVKKKDLPSTYRKINVFAKDDETVLVCFCSSEEEVKRKSVHDIIDRISQEKGALANSIKKYYGPDYKPKIIWILATDNIIWSGQDREFAEKSSVNVITEKELRYFLQVADHLRGAARYQFLAEYLKDQHIPEMKGRRVPAIRGKLGGRKFYAFVSRPEDLLKISFVNHRSLNDPQGAPSYQRLVSRSRLRNIGAFISSGGFFPTNILINFTRKIRFDVRQTDDHTGVAWGDLYMPDQYRSAWIIDGQHRLYGYAPLSRKYQSQNIVVIAFEDLPKEKEAELFVTINHEQKSVPKTLLDDLEGDLKWESDKPGERVGAMAARLVGSLNADVGEPFYGRVTGQGIPVTEKMCLTVPAVKEAIRKSGLVGRVSVKTRQYHPGPLSGGSDQETVERARETINLFFKYVKESNLHIWNAGKRGLLATNTAVHAYLVLLAELIRFSSLKKSVDPVEMESAEIFEFVQIYLAPIREKLSSMSVPDMELEFRVVFGSGGPKEYYFKLCSLISKRFPDFNPVGFEQWKEERSEGRIESADKRLKEINIVVQNTIFSVLKDVYGDSEKGYWEQGVKDKEMMTAAYGKKLDDDGSDLPLEHYLDFIQYKKVASRKENWPHLKDYLGIPLPGEKPSSKDVKWMESINSLRRIPAHATSRRTYKAEDFVVIDYVYDQLQLKIPEEFWGWGNGNAG